MPSGSCYCGRVKISYSGNLVRQALCHCTECKKYTGSAYSINLVVPEKEWWTEGTFQAITKTADSGNPITTYFCPQCGSSMYRTGPTFGGQAIIQAGILDDPDVINNLKMEVELFAPKRVCWVPKLAGTEEKHDMN